MTDPRTSGRGGARAEWFAAADRMLGALVPYRLSSGAGIALPGRASWSGEGSDRLEGYARSFLLAAFRLAGAAGEDPDGLIPTYRAGLIAGTDPDHPERWIGFSDQRQALVEAASIVLGLHLTRPWIWDTLSPVERRRFTDWLLPSARIDTPGNNWVLFHVVVQEFLAGEGVSAAPEMIRAGFDRIDGWYEGEGWYRDGDGQNFDYYNAWAMHLYPLLWSRMAERRDPGFAAEIRARAEERLAAFLPAHVRFFGADGTPIFQGRSLMYRFAALAPIWMGELHGVSPLSPGQTRRLTSRVLDRFLDGGALDERGLLTSGWMGPFPPMVQDYSGPASPYWASKGFVGLLLPEDAAVWSASEEPAPVERDDAELVLAGPGFLLSTTADDGIARLVNHGSDHHPLGPSDATLYDRLGYSSATAPSFDDEPVDQHVAILDDEGRSSRRGLIERLPAGIPGTLASRHEAQVPPPVPDGSSEPRGSLVPGRMVEESTAPPAVLGVISTVSLVYGASAVHLHVVETEPGRTIRFGGFAVNDAGDGVTIAPGIAQAVGSGLRSQIADLRQGAEAVIHRSRGTSPYGGESVVPALQVRAGATRSVHVVWTCLTGREVVPPLPPQLRALDDDGAIVDAVVRFADGVERVLRLETETPMG